MLLIHRTESLTQLARLKLCYWVQLFSNEVEMLFQLMGRKNVEPTVCIKYICKRLEVRTLYCSLPKGFYQGVGRSSEGCCLYREQKLLINIFQTFSLFIKYSILSFLFFFFFFDVLLHWVILFCFMITSVGQDMSLALFNWCFDISLTTFWNSPSGRGRVTPEGWLTTTSFISCFCHRVLFLTL